MPDANANATATTAAEFGAAFGSIAAQYDHQQQGEEVIQGEDQCCALDHCCVQGAPMQGTHHKCRHCQLRMHAPCGKEVSVQNGVVTVVPTGLTFLLARLNPLGHGDANNDVTGYSEICARCHIELMTPLPSDNAPPAAAAAAFHIDEEWIMPRNVKYEPYIRHVMTFVHGRNTTYPLDTIFTRAQLLELKPQHIRDFMAKKAYKKVEFSHEDGDRPIHARSSSLEQVKKGVSFFMPNNHPHWCNGQGNPTKSEVLTKLINDIKLMEVRGEGAPTKAKRAFSAAEFIKELEMMRRHGGEKKCFNHQVKYIAMCLWQYHLIGRSDDVAHFQISSPKGHDLFPFALKTKVQWSKNVRDEQRCPDQILLGSGDE